MEKINFENLPSTNTPLDADNLNDMQSNIEKSVVAVGKTQPSTNENVWIKKGKNLFDKNNVLNGYRFSSDGALYADSDFSATDYIEVNSGTQYTVSWAIHIVQCVCYYDENKNFISRNGSEKTFTTPENCRYIRASVATANINSAQIEQGSQTTYEPYVEKEILVKNNNGVFEKFFNADNLNFSFGKGIRNNSLTSGNCKYCKFNKLVCLFFSDIIANQALGSNTVLFSGLPRAKEIDTFILQSYSEFYQTRCRIEVNGNVSIHYSSMGQGSGARQYYGMFIYETI